MEAFEDILMFLGSTVCHQLEERSYFFDGVQMPLCARCIGIHFGFILATAYLLVGPKRLASTLPSTRQLAVLAAVMAFYFIDAGLSYSGISTSDNLRRTLSGLALGIPLPFVIVPLLNTLAHIPKPGVGVLEKPVDWLAIPVLYGLGLGAIILAESVGPLFYAVSVVGVAGVFVFFTGLFSAITMILLEGSRLRPAHKVTVAFGIAFTVLMVLGGLHSVFPTT
jgi:uncharacterized membrane protein